MKDISEIYDLYGPQGKHAFSKVIAFTVVVGTLFLLLIGAINRAEEATVLVALIAATFSLDGFKANMKTKQDTLNGSTNGATG